MGFLGDSITNLTETGMSDFITILIPLLSGIQILNIIGLQLWDICLLNQESGTDGLLTSGEKYRRI
jgi:hypothetical protein